MNDVLQELVDTIQQRIDDDDSSNSYVAKLNEAGLDKILKKLGEEAAETIIAAKNADQLATEGQVVHESADLMFHMLVMLAVLGINFNAVLQELERRFGTSGLDEKASRRGAKTK